MKGQNWIYKVAAAALLASACSGTVFAESPEEEVQLQIAEASSADALQEKYGTVAVRYSYYNADETVVSEYIYRDAERYIYEMEGDVWVDKDGEVYGFDTEHAAPFRVLFVDGAYEDYRLTETLTNWDYLCELAAYGEVEYDGADGEHEFTYDTIAEMDYNGHTAEEGDRIREVYTVDAASMEITSSKSYLVRTDGTEVLLSEGEILFDAPEMEPDPTMREQIFSDDVRTVTVITDAGTEDEQTYSQTVGKGCAVVVYVSENFEDTLYTDAACTQEFDGEEDYQSSYTVYAKRIEEEDYEDLSAYGDDYYEINSDDGAEVDLRLDDVSDF